MTPGDLAKPRFCQVVQLHILESVFEEGYPFRALLAGFDVLLSVSGDLEGFANSWSRSVEMNVSTSNYHALYIFVSCDWTS